MWSVIKFLNAQGIAPIEIDRQLSAGPNVMSKQMNTDDRKDKGFFDLRGCGLLAVLHPDVSFTEKMLVLYKIVHTCGVTVSASGRETSDIMPKIKSLKSEILNRRIDEFGSDVFSTDGEVITCNMCKSEIKATKKSALQQHCNTAKHKQSVKQMTKASYTFPNKIFCRDLCNMMVRADIPFKKLNNPYFREFLEKYTTQHIPSESSIRKNYFPLCYEDVVNKIRENVGDNKIFVSNDEATDVTGRYVANIVVGILSPICLGKNMVITFR
ncbi:hypothetical protein ANN_05337 [Periplaneta americana]|uniref:CGG triplet repeat-binding protein 1 n=1 Tax=Periplaneta americana TaxID=6978 RepID=A0ABQ8TCQ0_PERAM|nr:hypothetical protein ANN_05337 [Periplaneta americana]